MAWMFVCCECCVLSGRGLCDGLILVQESPTDCGESLCVIKKPRKRGGWSLLPDCENTTTMGCNARKINKPNGMTETASVINMVKTEIHTSKLRHEISFLPDVKQQVSAQQRRTVQWLRELWLSHRCCWGFESSGTSRCVVAWAVPDASNDWGVTHPLRRERHPRRKAVYCQNQTKRKLHSAEKILRFITWNKTSQPVITLMLKHSYETEICAWMHFLFPIFLQFIQSFYDPVSV